MSLDYHLNEMPWDDILPFVGNVAGTTFALAHNGVLWNDVELRDTLKLPKTSIETDSYIAVQLLESQESLDFGSLKEMAEQVRGTFTFTVLTSDNDLYFVRGKNPMRIYWFKRTGLYLYASTNEVLHGALRRLPMLLEQPIQVDLNSGDILRIDEKGYLSRGTFDDAHLFSNFWCSMNLYDNHYCYGRQEYIEDLKAVASCEGYDPRIVDRLLQHGFTLWEIEETLYNNVVC